MSPSPCLVLPASPDRGVAKNIFDLRCQAEMSTDLTPHASFCTQKGAAAADEKHNAGTC